MKKILKIINVAWHVLAVAFLAYWCGSHEWVKLNQLSEQRVLSWFTLLFFSYLFFSYVYHLYKALKSLSTENAFVQLKEEQEVDKEA